MPERILTFTDEEVRRMLESGEMRLLISPSEPAQKGKSEHEKALEKTRKLFGDDFLGPEAIEKTWGYLPDQIPDIGDFFSPEELERAHELGQRLILRVDRASDGQPLTIEKMQSELQPKFSLDPKKGKILYKVDWYKDEPFYKTEVPKVKWALVSDGVIDDADTEKSTKNKNYLQQTRILANYLKSTVFAGQSIPSHYQATLSEFDSKKGALEQAMGEVLDGGGNWKKLARDLSQLQLNQLLRQSPAEVIYDMLLILQNSQNEDERFLPGAYTWTNRRAQGGDLVSVGYSDARGAHVDYWYPNHSYDHLGVVLSR